MNGKNILATALTLCMAALLASCGSTENPPPIDNPATTESPVSQPMPEPNNSDTATSDIPSAITVQYLDDNGTIIFPPEIEILAEDDIYFIPETDDFALVQSHLSDSIILTLFCFDTEGNAVSSVERWWFTDGLPYGTSGFGLNFGMSSEIKRNGNGKVEELRSGDLVYIMPDDTLLANTGSAYQTAKERLLSKNSSDTEQYWFSLPAANSTDDPHTSTTAQSGTDIYFPNVDMAQMPDILKKTVGSLSYSADTIAMSMDDPYQRGLRLEFENTTEADYEELMAHYMADTVEKDEDGYILYDWGRLRVKHEPDYRKITVDAGFTE